MRFAVPPALDLLRDEAARLKAGASQAATDTIRIDAGAGVLRGPRLHAQAVGPRLQEAHEQLLCDECSARVGQELLPTRCSYLYLDAGSRVALHQDVAACAWTLLTWVAGEPATVRCLPASLQGEELLAFSLACDGMPARGEDHVIGPGDALLIPGHRVAHGLLPLQGPATIATFCFATLERPAR